MVARCTGGVETTFRSGWDGGGWQCHVSEDVLEPRLPAPEVSGGIEKTVADNDFTDQSM